GSEAPEDFPPPEGSALRRTASPTPTRHPTAIRPTASPTPTAPTATASRRRAEAAGVARRAAASSKAGRALAAVRRKGPFVGSAQDHTAARLSAAATGPP